MNKNIMWIIIGVLVLIGGAVVLMKNSGQPQTPATAPTTQEQPTKEPAMSKNAVTIKDFEFSPATITVKKGETVTWTNNGPSGHSATADDESFNTEVMDQGTSETVTFDKVGSFGYHCIPHPNMQGTVVVEE